MFESGWGGAGLIVWGPAAGRRGSDPSRLCILVGGQHMSPIN